MNPIENLRKAIDQALSQAPVDETLSVLVGHLVGLTVELVRRQGHDTNKSITLDGGENRDLTISPPKGIKHTDTHIKVLPQSGPKEAGKRLDVQLGEKLFQFDSLDHWLNRSDKAREIVGLRADLTVCIDQKGRICTKVQHFCAAERDNAYPIEVYRMRPKVVVEGGAS